MKRILVLLQAPACADLEAAVLLISASARAVGSWWPRPSLHRFSQLPTQRQNCAADTAELRWIAQSVSQAAELALGSAVTAALKPPLPDISTTRSGTGNFRGLAEGRSSSSVLAKCISQRSRVLWLASFFKTIQPLGITLYFSKTIPDLKERVTSFCCRQKDWNIWKGQHQGSNKMQS